MSSVVYFALSDQIWYSEGVYYPKGYSYETAAGFVASKDSALSIPYDSGTWGECAVRCNTKSSSPYYFIFNSTAMNRLFPNATAHPTAIGAAVRVCRNLISGNVWHYTLVDGETILSCSHNSSSYSSYENTVTAASSSLVANATRNSTIKVGMRLEKNNSGFFLYGNVITQFTRYDFSATAGSNIATASVSSSTGYDGDTITYSCVLTDGSTFDGWYNGSTKVSSSQTYTHTVNGADVSLTAVGTAPTTKTMSATYNGTQLSGFPINVSGNTDIAYNGTTIATVPFSGGTKTLNCSGKLMSGNVTAGGKTLNCSGKVMSGDVVFTIS